MSELINKLRSEFQDKEYRHAYAEECLNAVIAAQIKALREQRGMTQKQLAENTGMAQPRITLLEDASYENWTINTLKRFAKAFDVALSVKFEEFSRFIRDFETLSPETMQQEAFPDDIQFHSAGVKHRRQQGLRQRQNRTRVRSAIIKRRSGIFLCPGMSQPQEFSMGVGRKLPRAGVIAPQPSQDANELRFDSNHVAGAGSLQ